MEQGLARNIILIGFMGSGKTTVGKKLAARLSYRFCDTDRMLEDKTKVDIKHIFEIHGEEHFRNLETELLEELRQGLDCTVLSTGGGLPLREQNANLLREMGQVVFLKASRQTILTRLQGDKTRPLLQGEDVEQKIDRMLESRTPLYEKAAHLIVASKNQTVEELVDQIIEKLNQ